MKYKTLREVPEGYMISSAVVKKFGVTRMVLSSWNLKGKIETVKVRGIMAIKITPEFKRMVEKYHEHIKRRREKKDSAKKYINEKGEITDFWKWVRLQPRAHIMIPESFPQTRDS